jgi:hypothetical protein
VYSAAKYISDVHFGLLIWLLKFRVGDMYVTLIFILMFYNVIWVLTLTFGDLQRCGQLQTRQLQARMRCCAWPQHHDGSCCLAISCCYTQNSLLMNLYNCWACEM